MNCDDYRDWVAADIDGRLDAPTAQASRAHVETCTHCAALRAAQAAMRDRLRRHEGATMPPELRRRVLAAVQRELTAPVDPPATGGRVVRLLTRRRLLMVGAVAASFLVMMLPVGRWSQPDLLGLLIQDARAAEHEGFAYDLRSNDIAALRDHYAQAGVGFTATAPDLAKRGYRPIGGRVERDGEVAATVTVYHSAGGGVVVCRRYAYERVEVPPGERFGHATVVTRDGVTMRFVRDGDALCSLATTMPREQFLREFGLAAG